MFSAGSSSVGELGDEEMEGETDEGDHVGEVGEEVGCSLVVVSLEGRIV